MSAPVDCGIEMVRGKDGYLCGRMGSEVCSDCGTALCDLHADACDLCLAVFCGCCLYFHSKNHVIKPVPARTIPERRSA
jgi:hypothetical protein